jgi:hypothetical protein
VAGQFVETAETVSVRWHGSIVKKLVNMDNLSFGVGLRWPHHHYLMTTPSEQWGVDWFEIISEDFFDGLGSRVLARILAHKRIALHGVSLNIGGTDPLNFDYLHKLKILATQTDPRWISDHLCWTGVAGVDTHDLLPLPLTEETLAHVTSRVHCVQEYLDRPLVLENPSSYIQWSASEMTETEFLKCLIGRTGCSLLLDVNNAYVTAHNQGRSPIEYLQNFPMSAVAYLHIAGHSESPLNPAVNLTDDFSGILIDTHDRPVISEVWSLYRLAQHYAGGLPTLLEWDSNIPSFPELAAELDKARAICG